MLQMLANLFGRRPVSPPPFIDPAAEFGLQLFLERFWPPASYIYNRSLPHGIEVWVLDSYICPEMYSAKTGDLVPVYADAEHVYRYRVTGFSWAGGDDHIVSPKQFDLRFEHRMSRHSFAEVA